MVTRNRGGKAYGVMFSSAKYGNHAFAYSSKREIGRVRDFIERKGVTTTHLAESTSLLELHKRFKAFVRKELKKHCKATIDSIQDSKSPEDFFLDFEEDEKAEAEALKQAELKNKKEAEGDDDKDKDKEEEEDEDPPEDPSEMTEIPEKRNYPTYPATQSVMDNNAILQMSQRTYFETFLSSGMDPVAALTKAQEEAYKLMTMMTAQGNVGMAPPLPAAVTPVKSLSASVSEGSSQKQ